MKYTFTNPDANAVTVWAKNSVLAWRKLEKTHAYYFQSTGWTMHKPGEISLASRKRNR